MEYIFDRTSNVNELLWGIFDILENSGISDDKKEKVMEKCRKLCSKAHETSFFSPEETQQYYAENYDEAISYDDAKHLAEAASDKINDNDEVSIFMWSCMDDAIKDFRNHKEDGE